MLSAGAKPRPAEGGRMGRETFWAADPAELLRVGEGFRLAEVVPNAELTVWPEAGHAPFLSQPDRFRSWLR